jgi:hypothetical protein
LIFTNGEQVLLVQGVNVRLGVLVDDMVQNDNGPAFVCGTDPIHGKTTRKIGYGIKQAFKSLQQVVRNVVLVHLDHSPPGSFFIQKVLFHHKCQ